MTENPFGERVEPDDIALVINRETPDSDAILSFYAGSAFILPCNIIYGTGRDHINSDILRQVLCYFTAERLRPSINLTTITLNYETQAHLRYLHITPIATPGFFRSPFLGMYCRANAMPTEE
ncbi:hypothetical protein [Methanofollis ethanolicus]|uniref:hypothetical protein n=1 Tax=Methanofollis ethanolicus TaxID=488124 RepID=UPI001F21DB54|nr:hypothetical protein [Methanofollis ethanolicus]